MIYADVVLKDGKVLSSTGDFVEAIAIHGETITLLGRSEEASHFIGPKTEVIDLAGRIALPGFIDSHTHFIQTGLQQTFAIDLAGTSNRQEALDKLAQAVRDRGPGEWILGQGWDESQWPDRRYLTRKELDRIGPKSPIAAVRVDGHMVSVNSAALDRADLQGPADEPGLQEGILRESMAWNLLQAIEPDLSILVYALAAACRLAASCGVTSIHDQVVRPGYLRAYQTARRKKALTVRVAFYAGLEEVDDIINLGLESGFGDHSLCLGGIGEIFVDGSIGAMNAALAEPYRDGAGAGKLNMTRDELAHLLKRADQAGLQTALHAIGERAIEIAISAHALAETSPHLRHRIEHLELPGSEHLVKMADLGLIASMQPNFAQWSGPDKMYEQRLGKERDRRIDPHRSVLDVGVPLAFGSDCMPFGALYGIHWAVNAPHPDQRLSVAKAIDGYTRQGAHLTFEKGVKGELAEGKLADIVVLDRDPFLHPQEIAEIMVDITLLGGKVIYRRQDSAGATSSIIEEIQGSSSNF